ncbi:MAG: cytochrome c oxidase subunit 3 [Ilumatobacteraceae bacterium]
MRSGRSTPRRGERSSAALALGATGLVAIAVVNAQAFVYSQMGLPIADTAYGPMFYAVTGVFLVLMVVGLAFTVVTAFRVLGGRSDGDVVAAHALYWYFVAAAFAAIWLIVYVTK